MPSELPVAADRRSGGPVAPPLRRAPHLVLGATCGALAATLAIALVPDVAFGLQASALHAGIETAATAVAVLAAFLVVGRFQQTGSLVDLALVGALTLLAVGNLAFATAPALAEAGESALTTWAPVVARLLSAAAFVAAAIVPDIRLASPKRAGVAVLVGIAGILALTALGTGLLSDALPAVAHPTSQAAADEPSLEGPAGFIVLHAVTLVLFAAAAVGFARRAVRSHDELLLWIAVAMALAAVARVNYLLYPAVDGGWVFSGDFLRLASFTVLLVGALREIRSYQRHVALSAVLDERRRVARDLHDGLSQELAFINLQSQRLEMQGGGPEATRLVEASRRALDESRQAIEALSRRNDEPLAVTISKVAEQLAGRAGARLRLDLDAHVDVPPAVRDELLRILREAVTNGVRHGQADEIAVRLSQGERLCLEVSDNGRGFEPGGDSSGFGLTSMRERATGLGGTFEVRSRPGRGTRVEVTLP